MERINTHWQQLATLHGWTDMCRFSSTHYTTNHKEKWRQKQVAKEHIMQLLDRCGRCVESLHLNMGDQYSVELLKMCPNLNAVRFTGCLLGAQTVDYLRESDVQLR